MALCLLTACGESIKSSEPPELAEPPVVFTEPCQKPVVIEIPKSVVKLPQAKAEFYWIQDRKRLIECGDKHLETVNFYRDRDGRIRNGSP